MIEAGAREHMAGWDTDHESDIDCHIVCPKCSGRIDESHRTAMQKLCIVQHRRPDAKVFSVSISWFHSSKTMAEVGELEWRLKNSPSLNILRDLYQNVYSIPVSQADESPKQVSSRVTKETLIERRANYASGTIPPSIVATIGAMDIQKKWGYTALLGVDASMSVYWLDWTAFELVPRELQQTMDATPAMVLEGIENAYQALMKHSPRAVWVDASYKHSSSDVPLIREWCKKYSNIFQVAGRSNTQFSKINAKMSLPAGVRDYMQPRQQEGGQTLFFLDVDRLKSSLADKMKYAPNSPGGVYFPKDLHEKGRSWLMDHLTNEEPKMVTTRQGVNVIKWEPSRWARSRNDLWDCSVYAFAGALLYQGINQQAFVKPAVVAKPQPKFSPRPQLPRRQRFQALGF
jgi:phage terminase large subunit GpA-like protein